MTFFFLMLRLQPTSTLFPYTTLFRSKRHRDPGKRQDHASDLGWRQRLPPKSCCHEQGLNRNRRQPHRSEEHTSELQSPCNLVCRLLLEKKKTKSTHTVSRAIHNKSKS